MRGTYHNETENKTYKSFPKGTYKNVPLVAIDFQGILKAILQSYLDLEDKGMYIDLRYGGKLYRNIEVKFHMNHMKVDTERG